MTAPATVVVNIPNSRDATAVIFPAGSPPRDLPHHRVLHERRTVVYDHRGSPTASVVQWIRAVGDDGKETRFEPDDTA